MRVREREKHAEHFDFITDSVLLHMNMSHDIPFHFYILSNFTQDFTFSTKFVAVAFDNW